MTQDDNPTGGLSIAPDDDHGPDHDIGENDRVPIDEITEQTDVTLTSFFDAANSMGTWYPPLEELDIPLPKTHLIELEGGTDAYLGMSKGELTPLFMSEDPDLKMEFIGRPELPPVDMKELIETEYNGEDVFLRSFYKSARHLDDMAGQITDPTVQNIKQTIGALMDDHIMQSVPTGSGIAIREFLDLDFMPEANRTFHPEVRFFVGDGEVKYHWPRMHKESFVNATGDETFYNTQVERIESNIDQLRTYAERVAERYAPHGWSVDFVMDTDGEWYCTDMAVDALYWNEKLGKWNNMSEHESGSEFNLEETVGTELPPPQSPPSGFPAWRDPQLERPH